MEEQPPGRIARVKVLVQNVEMDLLTLELVRDLTQMERGPGQPIEAGDDQRISFPDIF